MKFSDPQSIATALSLAAVPFGIAIAYIMFELPCQLPLCFEWESEDGKVGGQISLAVFYAWLFLVAGVLYAVSCFSLSHYYYYYTTHPINQSILNPLLCLYITFLLSLLPFFIFFLL
jgi:hypothetical protein